MKFNNNIHLIILIFYLDEDGEKSVSVLLDAEESELIFLDKSNAVSPKTTNIFVQYIDILNYI